MPINNTLSALLFTALLLLGACQSTPDKQTQPDKKDVIKSVSNLDYQSELPPQTLDEDWLQTESLQPGIDPHLPDEAAPIDIAEIPAKTVWDLIVDEYALTPRDDKRIDREIDWLVKHPDYVRRVSERARPYIYFIYKEAQARDIPGEIALLPVVESAFQPFAYSRSKAAGIWQFIPSTGRYFGMKQNWWYDGRRDIVKSTRAALDYLVKLNKRFDGDWDLALAAYNAGGGTISKAIKRNKRRGLPTTYWGLSLKRETRNYVPRLRAVARVFANPENYSATLDPVVPEDYFAQIDIASQIDLALAADMANISMEELYVLNPGFNRWATDPKGPHKLLIPVDRADGFRLALAELPDEQRIQWARYRIRSGDSLSVIARRHKTRVDILRDVNNLSGNTIVAGRHLLIPKASKAGQFYALSQEQRERYKGKVTKSTVKRTHTVRRGDSLWQIARDNDTTVKNLVAWNKLNRSAHLKPGQKLTVYKTIERRKPTTVAKASLQKISYVVVKGDSLSRIAKRYNVSVADLKNWNTTGKYLQPGQKLTLLVDATAQVN